MLTTSTEDGHILSATMSNPVRFRARRCRDRALTECGPETAHEIVRAIRLDEE